MNRSGVIRFQVLKDELIWHGEIESKLDNCNPLLCVAIYDSCRDNPPEVIADIVKNTRLEPCWHWLFSIELLNVPFKAAAEARRLSACLVSKRSWVSVQLGAALFLPSFFL